MTVSGQSVIKKGGRVFLLCLAAVLVLSSGCSALRKAVGTDSGMRLEAEGTEYVLCNILAVKPIALGEAYAQFEDMTYYTVPYQDPEEFLCDFDTASGSSYVYRNVALPDLTLESFDAIAAWIYLDGVEPTMVGQFYADDRYLPEEKRGLNASQDTELVQTITNALTAGNPVTVPDSEYTDSDTYYFRMLGERYPGLYYLVCFFADVNGNYYLEDMGTFKIVNCPDVIRDRMVGGSEEAV